MERHEFGSHEAMRAYLASLPRGELGREGVAIVLRGHAQTQYMCVVPTEDAEEAAGLFRDEFSGDGVAIEAQTIIKAARRGHTASPDVGGRMFQWRIEAKGGRTCVWLLVRRFGTVG